MKKGEITAEQIWDSKGYDIVKEAIKKDSRSQSKERKLRNKLLSIQYKLEDLIKNITPDFKSLTK